MLLACFAGHFKYWCHWHLFGETPLRDPFHWTTPSPTEMQHRPMGNTGVQSVVRIFVLFFYLEEVIAEHQVLGPASFLCRFDATEK